MAGVSPNLCVDRDFFFNHAEENAKLKPFSWKSTSLRSFGSSNHANQMKLVDFPLSERFIDYVID